MSRNIKLSKKRFNRGNIKTFGFFLLFSTIIWIFVQFAKEYTQVVQVPLNYVNVPMDKSISLEKPDYLDLRIQDRGFIIIWKFQLFEPELDIDLSATEAIKGRLVYDIEANRADIAKQLNIDFDNASFLKKAIYINYQLKEEKKLKILPVTNLNYAIGYSADEELKITPDSVKVTGPKSVLDTLETINTLLLKKDNISSDLFGNLVLDTTKLGMLNFYQNEVEYSQNVEKFTEGMVEVPVEVYNVPAGYNLVIFPKEINVFYQVNLKEYENVEESDFRVVCDFLSVQAGEDFMFAEISDQPEFVSNVRLAERKIQFIIKR